LTADKFDADLLNEFTCDFFKASNGKAENYECTAEDLVVKHLPQDEIAYSGTEKLTHYTWVFNIFVFLQIVNLINARKIELGEFNVFKDFFNNFLFLGILAITTVFQLVIIEIGGMATKCAPLTMNQNLCCIGLGATSLLWGFLLKFLPLGWFQCI